MSDPFAKLRPHQPDHVRRLLDVIQRRGAVLDKSETGTGKTHAALVLSKLLDVTPLVIGPKAARFGWEQAGEIQGVDFEYVNYELARVRRKTRYKDEERLLTDTEWFMEKPWGKGSFLQMRQPAELVILDEVHRCASVNPTLNRKMLIAAKRQCGKILALSATAAENPLQLCALGYALGLHTLSKSSPLAKTTWHDFLYRYGCKPGVFGGWTWDEESDEAKDAMKRLNARLQDRSAAMKKADIPGFPRNQLEVMLLQDETGKAKELAERLHELYSQRKAESQAAAERGNALVEDIREKQALELLMVPSLAGLAVDYVQSSRLIFFVSYRQTREELCRALNEAGIWNDFIDGTQTGNAGDSHRRQAISMFQNDTLPALVVNKYAGSESLNLQGKMNRTTFIMPVESGRQAEQVIGRAHRDGGADALQFFCYFAGTRQEEIARRMQTRRMNMALMNDGDFRE